MQEIRIRIASKKAETQDGTDILANCVGYAAGRFNEIISRGVKGVQ